MSSKTRVVSNSIPAKVALLVRQGYCEEQPCDSRNPQLNYEETRVVQDHYFFDLDEKIKFIGKK